MAEKPLCSIPDCCNISQLRGWCKAHYLRWYRHGDPRKGGIMRTIGLPQCIVDGCNRKPRGRGYCSRHYDRWLTHGDPLGGQVAHGEARTFLEESVMSHSSDECLIWPYRRGKEGYARIDVKEGTMLVHRIVCERVHGTPPSATHHAAHTCGKGKNGCVSPNHLAWKTRRENESDKIAHGTTNRGERNGMVKLREHEARAIKASDERVGVLARRYNVSHALIGSIRNGRSWAWLD